MPFKIHGLFTSGIFHLIFFEPKAVESEAMDEEVEGQLSLLLSLCCMFAGVQARCKAFCPREASYLLGRTEPACRKRGRC